MGLAKKTHGLLETDSARFKSEALSSNPSTTKKKKKSNQS
jgi:hypothetical protein